MFVHSLSDPARHSPRLLTSVPTGHLVRGPPPTPSLERLVEILNAAQFPRAADGELVVPSTGTALEEAFNGVPSSVLDHEPFVCASRFLMHEFKIPVSA